jgi:hypothetical protein
MLYLLKKNKCLKLGVIALIFFFVFLLIFYFFIKKDVLISLVKEKKDWEIYESTIHLGAEYHYDIDEKFVYFFDKDNIIEGADYESLHTLEDIFGAYAKDKNSVYYMGIKIEGADPKTFNLFSFYNYDSISYLYSKDKENIFGGSEKVEGVDYESFTVLADHYAKDKNSIYCMGKKLKEADRETFTVLSTYHHGYARDKYSAYNGRKKIDCNTAFPRGQGNILIFPCQEKHQEFITSFTNDIGFWDSGIDQDEEIEKFIKKTGKEKFWSSSGSIYNKNLKSLQDNSEIICGDTKDSCQLKNVKVPDAYKVKWGTFLYIDEEGNQYNFFTEISSEKDFLFINEEKIEIGKIIDGPDGGIKNVTLVNGKISFLYRKNDMPEKELYDCYKQYSDAGEAKIKSKCGDEKFHWEYFHGEPNFSQKVGFDIVSKVFEYNGKIGFIGKKNEKWAVYFDKKKISEDFDEIRTTACCTVRIFPFKVYDNGVIFFMGRRGDEYILAESRL